MDAKLSEQEVARVYDFLAKFYDLWSAFTEAKARRQALELAEVEDGEDILEVAVGTGTAFSELGEEKSNWNQLWSRYIQRDAKTGTG